MCKHLRISVHNRKRVKGKNGSAKGTSLFYNHSSSLHDFFMVVSNNNSCIYTEIALMSDLL